jgi:hypothetical protein
LVHDLVEDGVAWAYGPRRTTFDKILVDAAVESGGSASCSWASASATRDATSNAAWP